MICHDTFPSLVRVVKNYLFGVSETLDCDKIVMKLSDTHLLDLFILMSSLKSLPGV